MLVCWAAIAVFRTAAIGFALCMCLCVCVCVSMPSLQYSNIEVLIPPYSVLPSIFANQQIHYLAVIKQMLVQALGLPNKEVKQHFYKMYCGHQGDFITGVDSCGEGNSVVCGTN